MKLHQFYAALGVFIISGLSFGEGTPAVNNSKDGPHGGQVVGEAPNTFEVKINSNGEKIEVFSLQGAKAKNQSQPKSIKLFRDPSTSQTVELKAIDTRAQFPRYEGSLGPNAGSVAGFQLTFETNLKALKVLRYMPYIPPRPGSR